MWRASAPKRSIASLIAIVCTPLYAPLNYRLFLTIHIYGEQMRISLMQKMMKSPIILGISAKKKT